MEALTGPQDSVADNAAIYQRRRDRVVQAVRRAGMEVDVPRASLYIWAKVPGGFTSAEFAQRLLEDLDVVVTPGSSYGRYGEGYIRLSLTTPDEQVEKGCQRIEGWAMPAPGGRRPESAHYFGRRHCRKTGHYCGRPGCHNTD